MYSKNIDLTIHHCKKAYCYYIEFIGQIRESSKCYLQLNSKDAILFVYKKTIFDIDYDFRKKFVMSLSEKEFLDAATTMIDIFHELILGIIYTEDKILEKRESTIHFGLKASNKMINKVYNINQTMNQNLLRSQIILFFIVTIGDFVNDNVRFCSICESFIKKIKKSISL